MNLTSSASLCYQNVRGLNSKLRNLFLNSFSFDYNIIALTETWLRPNTLDAEILCDNFLVFRRDRLSRTGGGVLIAVRANLGAEAVSFDNMPDIEFLCVKVLINSLVLFITCSYIYIYTLFKMGCFK